MTKLPQSISTSFCAKRKEVRDHFNANIHPTKMRHSNRPFSQYPIIVCDGIKAMPHGFSGNKQVVKLEKIQEIVVEFVYFRQQNMENFSS